MDAKVKKYLTEDPRAPRCRHLRFDDLASLVAGVKSVVYTNISGGADAQALEAMCCDLKLQKIVLERRADSESEPPIVPVLIGTDTVRLRAACRSYAHGESASWGAALDYPECCVESFTRWERQPRHKDLIHHIWANSRPGAPISFLMNNVCNFHSRLRDVASRAAFPSFQARNQGFDWESFLPWHPCSYSCRRSLGRSRRVYEVLKLYMPHMAAFRRKALSKPMIFWDQFQFAVLDGSCLKVPGGLVVSYRGVCQPRSLISGRIERALNRQELLKVSAGGTIVEPRGMAMPGPYVFLPFAAA